MCLAEMKGRKTQLMGVDCLPHLVVQQSVEHGVADTASFIYTRMNVPLR